MTRTFLNVKKYIKKLKFKYGRARRMTPEYYQNLHETSIGYMENNWLLEEIDEVLSCHPEKLLELGYGNGKFLRHAASRVSSLFGVDWACSPHAYDMPTNVNLIEADVTEADLPHADLVCSADVLEHFPPEKIDEIIKKLCKAGTFNFHVIACYDDKHSHLCILTPEDWLKKFKRHSSDYQLKKVTHRSGDINKLICSISNY